jgi:ATP-dependent Lhr-like helicase
MSETHVDAAGAAQLVAYVRETVAALGAVPTMDAIIAERFFDEAGGMQLVLHAPFGGRINRAFGLALRKRFCVTFDFELQAAATDDGIVISLGEQHSFPLESVFGMVRAHRFREDLIQAALQAPMFGTRWRWNATTALALPRFVGGNKVAPQLQRMKSEDLLATVFPDQVACLENIVGERQIPDHPLVAQTLHDCLHEAMDIEGLERLLRSNENGEIRFVCRDLTAPSPLAAEILTSKPYTFLDDAPLEERRTQAVMSRRWGDYDTTDDFGKLDAEAIAAVREEAWPEARNADELHEALMALGFVTHEELQRNAGWAALFDQLVAERRATRLRNGLHVAAERLPEFSAALAEATLEPPIAAPAEFAAIEWTPETALVEIVRGRLGGLGPVRPADLAASMNAGQADVDLALVALETEGYALRGRFTPAATDTEWCERHLLARIHRYTVKRLRREIEPVAPRDFMRFLFEWQHVAPGAQVSGPDALASVLAQLEGFEVAAAAWEADVLPARVAGYEISWLDDLCRSGRVAWSRLRTPAPRDADATRERAASGPVRATPIVLLQRRNLGEWNELAGASASARPELSSRARAVADELKTHGASFFDELLGATRLLHTELEDALAELVATGTVTSDSFAGLRALLLPPSKRPSTSRRHGRRAALFGIADAGRWALVRKAGNRESAIGNPDDTDGSAAGERAQSPARSARNESQRTDAELVEFVARTLLKRYGVVCWRLLAREPEWLPPWRELLRVYHRLEARGEIRGGRFIAGLTGEQFALPEAIGLLRGARQKPQDGSLVALCGCDPLNLAGIVLAGARVPNQASARVLFRDGLPIATLVGGQFTALEPMDDAAEWAARSRLLRAHAENAPLAETGAVDD